MTAIHVDNVTKRFKVFYDRGYSLKERVLFTHRNRYNWRVALDDISFDIEKGETFGIIGNNGSGKSTMLKLLTRIMYPTSGKIAVTGRVASLIELGAGFHPDMSGKENIFINASIFGLSRKEINERLDSIVDFSGLQAYIDNPIRTYSSGMYMRLAFSIAINVDADVLLVDEILAVGDATFQKQCFAHMQQLKDNGVTIAIVSHDMNTISSFCDRALWLDNGKEMVISDAKQTVEQYTGHLNSSSVISI